MVSLSHIRASNSALTSSSPALTAVFVGGTNGIGLATLRELARKIVRPTVYIVGRSAARFQGELDQLKALRPEGRFIFIQADVSLVKEVDRVCEDIQQRESSIDLLWCSAGFLPFGGRQETPEGLDTSMALQCYTRIRFIQQLLPLLRRSHSPRVVSMLAGGKESKLITEDLGLSNPSNYNLIQAGIHNATMMTLTLRTLAAAPENRNVAFVHPYPGLVRSNIFSNGNGGWLSIVMRWVVSPIVMFFARTPEEAGERSLWLATGKEFAGTGKVWLVGQDGDVTENKELLTQYEEDGTQQKVADHVFGQLERIAGT